MISHICIFEDEHYTRLSPLIYFRPTFNLRCGIFSLKEKVLYAYPKATVSLHTRSYLADYMKLRNPGFEVNSLKGTGCLFINGRALVDSQFVKTIRLSGDDSAFFHNGEIVAARVTGKNFLALKNRLPDVFTPSTFNGIPREDVDVKMARYPWNLVHYNGDQIREDFEVLQRTAKQKKRQPVLPSGVHILNRKDVFIGQGSTIFPGAVIDAMGGPVYIGKNVTIMPFSYIVGPGYVGDGSVIKSGAKIYHNTSIGPVCKVGGEVEESIIHSYSNKQHDGFLGHSYLGAWVNCGAGTVTSDLKNNYGTVKVSVNGEQIDSGLQFVGLTIGDHSKTAINSTFNTGTVVGVSCNIFGTGFPPKDVPSFSWGAAGETFTTYNVEKAITVARKVMSRRKISLSTFEEQLFRKLFELTGPERRKRGMPV